MELAQEALSKSVAQRMAMAGPSLAPAGFVIQPPENSIYVGKTRLLNQPFFWNQEALANPHIVVTGTSGSGKSYLVKTLLTRASIVWGTSSIILDWSGEYAPWARASGGTVIDIGGQVGINILERTGGSAASMAQSVLRSFRVLTGIKNEFVQQLIMQQALEQVYMKAGCGRGNRSAMRSFAKAPTLADLGLQLGRMEKKCRGRRLEHCQYVRLVVNEFAQAFGGKRQVGLKRLAGLAVERNGMVCLDLHRLGSEAQKSMAALCAVQYLRDSMATNRLEQGQKIRLFIVADEAWKIAKDEESDLVSIAREGRKYGFSVIIATQNPTDVGKAVLSNAGTSFIFRTVLSEHRKYLCDSYGFQKSQEAQIERLGVGGCLIHLAYSNPAHGCSTFAIGRVDGEQPVEKVILGVGNMKLELERAVFEGKLLEAGLSFAQVEELVGRAAQNAFHIGADALVVELEKAGLHKSSAISVMMGLGFDESHVAKAFAFAEAKKLGRLGSITQLVPHEKDGGSNYGRAAEGKSSEKHGGKKKLGRLEK